MGRHVSAVGLSPAAIPSPPTNPSLTMLPDPTGGPARPPLTPEADALLSEAAELRAGGLSWDAAARKIGVGVGELRGLARAHRTLYRRYYADAYREVIDDSFAEAVLSLRRQLRSDDEKAARESAGFLARVWMTRVRHRRRSGTPAAPRLSSENEQLVAFLDSLPPEEVEAKCRHVANCDFQQRFGFWPDDPPEGF